MVCGLTIHLFSTVRGLLVVVREDTHHGVGEPEARFAIAEVVEMITSKEHLVDKCYCKKA